MEGVFFGLTAASEIRAQLGAGTEEFDDSYMEDLGLADELKLNLLDWFPSFMALSDDEGSDANIVRQKLALKAYARTYCALKAIPTVRLRFVQKKADGDNQASRFQSKDTINELQEDLRARVADLKATVLSLETAHTPAVEQTSTGVLGIRVSTPSSNVITG